MPNLIPFTQMTDRLPYPKQVKARLSTIHAEIVNYVLTHFHNSARYKSNVVSLLNTISFIVLSGDTIPPTWAASDPFIGIEFADDESAKNLLGNLYINDKSIKWDIEESEIDEAVQTKPHRVEVKAVKKSDIPRLKRIYT